MKTRTKIKDLSQDRQAPQQEELSEAELDLATGGRLAVQDLACTCPNTCGPCGPDDH
ncbi:MAG: hypothetical protein JXB05_01625 [Myxococcaceae bacterium]|nr:hypothetical protein [Myxococcaceae bacterium]